VKEGLGPSCKVWLSGAGFGNLQWRSDCERISTLHWFASVFTHLEAAKSPESHQNGAGALTQVRDALGSAARLARRLRFSLESSEKPLPAGITKDYFDGAHIRRKDGRRHPTIHLAEQLIQLSLRHLPGRTFTLRRDDILFPNTLPGAIRQRYIFSPACNPTVAVID